MKSSNGWILFDTVGNKLAGPFDTIRHFSNKHFAIVMKKGKYGIIDRKGRITKKIKYDDLNYFIYDATAILFSRKKKYGLMDTWGKVILKPKYTLIDPKTRYYTSCYLFSDSHGKLFYVDDYGTKYVK